MSICETTNYLSIYEMTNYLSNDNFLDLITTLLHVYPSWKLLCIKVSPDLHLTFSKNGGNLGLVLKMENIACISIILTKHVKYTYLYLFYTVL